MTEPVENPFKNEKTVKDALMNSDAESLAKSATNVKEAELAHTVAKQLEKHVANALLQNKDAPFKWLDLYKARLILEQTLQKNGSKLLKTNLEQDLFDAVLASITRTVLHEQLDLDPDEDGTDLSEILDGMDSPADYCDEELDKDEDFQNALQVCSSKDVEKVRARLAYTLTHNNMAYTLKRANYKLEEVKVQTVGFLGRRLFPMLSVSEKHTKAKTPCEKGMGDWIDTPTSFILARANDLMQETKGRLALYAENKRQAEDALHRRQKLFLKIKQLFKRK